jgi:hypothetical protein
VRYGLRWVATGVVAFCLCQANAHAQLGPNGSPLRTSHYAVDLYQGPVVASTRVIGMAGAYVAIAEGAEGNFVNPVAPAVRQPWSHHTIDYDVGLGLMLPNALKNSDYFNSGADRTNLSTSAPDEFVFLDAEGHIQVGTWGLGSAVFMQRYGLRRDVTTTDNAQVDQLRAQFAVGLIDLAHAMADGQLLLGVGIRAVGLSVSNNNPRPDQTQTLFGTQGLGYQAGFLWCPHGLSFRTGAALRTTVSSNADPTSRIEQDASGNRVLAPGTLDEMYLPDRVSLPWDLNIGFAVQFGPRPLNPPWLDPASLLSRTRTSIVRRREARQRETERLLHDARQKGQDEVAMKRALLAEDATLQQLDLEEWRIAQRRAVETLRAREKALARWYFLLSSSVNIIGPTPNAVGVESFLQRVVDRSGERAVLSPHLGIESEVIPSWSRLRVGFYGEPTRFSNGRASPRAHTTFGIEQKVFPWSVFGLYQPGSEWRIQAAVDMSERYLGWSASIGLWH